MSRMSWNQAKPDIIITTYFYASKTGQFSGHPEGLDTKETWWWYYALNLLSCLVIRLVYGVLTPQWDHMEVWSRPQEALTLSNNLEINTLRPVTYIFRCMECMENHAITQGYLRESHAKCDGSATIVQLRFYLGYWTVCTNLRCNADDKMEMHYILYVPPTTGATLFSFLESDKKYGSAKYVPSLDHATIQG